MIHIHPSWEQSLCLGERVEKESGAHQILITIKTNRKHFWKENKKKTFVKRKDLKINPFLSDCFFFFANWLLFFDAKDLRHLLKCCCYQMPKTNH
jgi:hypothetical protein